MFRSFLTGGPEVIVVFRSPQAAVDELLGRDATPRSERGFGTAETGVKRKFPPLRPTAYRYRGGREP